MGYFDGVGVRSIEAAVAAAEASQLMGPLPLLFVTSSLRDVPQPYHGTGNAIDLGNNADQWNGSSQMDDFARWLATFYGPFSLEIIHVYAGGLPAGQAQTEEWKFGEKQTYGWYGWDTLNGHRGHVHWAITQAGLDAADAYWQSVGQLTDWFDMATQADLEAAVETVVRKILAEATGEGQKTFASTVKAILHNTNTLVGALKRSK